MSCSLYNLLKKLEKHIVTFVYSFLLLLVEKKIIQTVITNNQVIGKTQAKICYGNNLQSLFGYLMHHSSAILLSTISFISSEYKFILDLYFGQMKVATFVHCSYYSCIG